MKYPITLSLAIPVLLIVFTFVGGDGKTVLITIGVLALMFLLEIKVKHGNISTETINKFFNTPISKDGISDQEKLAKAGLKEKFSLIGFVIALVWLIGGIAVGLKIYAKYKNFELLFGIDIKLILFMTYFMGLAVINRIFFVEKISD